MNIKDIKIFLNDSENRDRFPAKTEVNGQLYDIDYIRYIDNQAVFKTFEPLKKQKRSQKRFVDD